MKYVFNLETNYRAYVLVYERMLLRFTADRSALLIWLNASQLFLVSAQSARFSVKSLGAFTFEFILKVAVCNLKKQHITANNALC